MKPDQFRRKPQVIHINISSTFVIKNRCRKCNGQPSEYWQIHIPYHYLDPQDGKHLFYFFKEYMKSFAPYWHRVKDPRYRTSLKSLNFYYGPRFYHPDLHQKNKIGVDNYTDQVIEYARCSCGRSVWAFGQLISNIRPEIKNRKGRYSYPRKFRSF